MSFNRFLNLPNYLTLIRLIFSSIFLPFFLVYFLPLNIFWLNILLALLFILLSLTDFFDGYLARKYNLETNFGKALDPIADKFLISASLISLLSIKKIWFFWVMIFILREMFIMGLRQIALENNFSIPVSLHGKLKMTFQVLMIIVIIINPFHSYKLVESYFNIFELLLILITFLLSISSAINYYNSFKNKLFNLK